MFKKILAAFIMLFTLSAWSAERISIVWGFAAGSNQANFYRAMVNELNSMQNKYEFVFENRQGAGGAVAGRYVLANADHAIFGGTSTFFLRSQFDTQTGYSTSEFKPVCVQTLGAPLVLLSRKYTDLKSFNNRGGTVSVSGFGSSSHLVASILQEQDPTVRIVNYTTLVDANKDVMGQHIDAGWNFYADVDKLIESGTAHGLALTGKHSLNGVPTFKQVGVNGFEELTSNTAMFVSAKMPEDKAKELHELLRKVNNLPAIHEFYAREYSHPADFDYEQTKQWYIKQEVFWTVQSRKIRPF